MNDYVYEDEDGDTVSIEWCSDGEPVLHASMAGVILSREAMVDLRDQLTAYLGDGLPDATADGYDWPAGESSVATEAHGLVYGDRQDAYEHPRIGFTRTAIIWQAILMDKLADGESVSPQDVVMCMAGIKLAREAGNPRRDNRVDLAGYAICLDRLETGK